MNKISKKTYGARGLLEWHLALPAGEATVKYISQADAWVQMVLLPPGSLPRHPQYNT